MAAWTAAALLLTFLATGLGACGGDDSSEDAAADGGAGDTGGGGTGDSGGGEDAGEEYVVSEGSVDSVATDSWGEEVDGVEAIAVSAAAADATDSDELLAAMEANPPPKPAPDDCRQRTLNGLEMTVDYSGCSAQGSAGTVVVRRLAGGNWLVVFQDDFVFRGVDVDGFAVLKRKGAGLFDLGSSDDKGLEAGLVAIKLTRQGPVRTVTRHVFIRGDLGVLDQPFSSFSYGAEGSVKDDKGGNALELGLGGRKGESKNDPGIFRRPSTGRCPENGKLFLDGKFTVALKIVYKAVVNGNEHKFDVDLGPKTFDGRLVLDFDIGQSDGLGPLDLRPLSPLRADRDPILAAAEKLNEKDLIKKAIKEYVAKNDLPVIPDDSFAAGAAAALKELFGSNGLCK
jgi:hypothetical protein